MTPAISSPQNERIKAVRRLQRAKERKATGRTLLEGPHLLESAQDAGVLVEVIFIAEGDTPPSTDAEVIEVTDAVLDAIAPTESPRGPIAVIAVPDAALLEAEPTVVLWNIADPGNAGTLIRTAAALGWNVAVHGGADPWSPKVVRAAAGAHFSVPIAHVESLADLEKAGLTPVATVSDGGVPPDSLVLTGPTALLVGNEAAGLPREIVEGAGAVVTIPMQDTESLNVAAAGAIVMYVLGR